MNEYFGEEEQVGKFSTIRGSARCIRQERPMISHMIRGNVTAHALALLN
jgi:hypothetical protein